MNSATQLSFSRPAHRFQTRPTSNNLNSETQPASNLPAYGYLPFHRHLDFWYTTHFQPACLRFTYCNINSLIHTAQTTCHWPATNSYVNCFLRNTAYKLRQTSYRLMLIYLKKKCKKMAMRLPLPTLIPDFDVFSTVHQSIELFHQPTLMHSFFIH